jgi:hypothetical protein
MMSSSVKLYQSNKLTEAWYSLSVIEKKHIFLIIREVLRDLLILNRETGLYLITCLL